MDISNLITIGKSTHAAHDAEHIVVGGKDIHTGRRGRANCIVGHREQERGVVNAGQVASAAGLVLLGLQGERVHVDANGGHVRVVLVGLHLVEIAAIAHLEPVVAVELQQGNHHGVLARHALHAGDGVARLQHGAVPPVREVEGLLALPGVDIRVIA